MFIWWNKNKNKILAADYSPMKWILAFSHCWAKSRWQLVDWGRCGAGVELVITCHTDVPLESVLQYKEEQGFIWNIYSIIVFTSSVRIQLIRWHYANVFTVTVRHIYHLGISKDFIVSCYFLFLQCTIVNIFLFGFQGFMFSTFDNKMNKWNNFFQIVMFLQI